MSQVKLMKDEKGIGPLGVPTGKTMDEVEAHKKGELHQGYLIMLIDREGVVVCKRAEDQYCWPGYWDISIALHPYDIDPPTLGHLDVIDVAALVFDKLVIVVATNPEKKYMFTAEQRKDMLLTMTEDFTNVEIVSTTCLVADIARDFKVSVLVRGLRATSDYEYELNMSYQNRHLNKEIVTVGIFPKQEDIHISSSTVRHLLAFHDDRWKEYVHPLVIESIERVRGKVG